MMQRSIVPGCFVLLVACSGDNYQSPLTLHDLTLTTAEDTPLTIDVSPSAGVLDAVVLSITVAPSHGTLSGTGPVWTYTPAHDYTGPDLIEVHGSDSTGSAAATVTITVAPADDAPVANPDSLAAGFNTPLTVAPATLLANDTDIDSATLSVIAVDAAVNGTVAIIGGNVVFIPDVGFEGAGSFDYTISDGVLTAYATVTVMIGNDAAPVAASDSANTDEDTALELSDTALLANDTDADLQTLAITSVGHPTHGIVSRSGMQITFTPELDFHGAASFEYTVSDGFRTDVGSVVVAVAPINDLPVAVADAAVTDEDVPLVLPSVALTDNDTDVDGDALTVSNAQATQGSHGTVGFADGVVTFTPDADYNGPAELSYTVSDGNGGTASALLSITVGPVNDPPVAAGDTFGTDEDTPLVLVVSQVTGNDSDVDGDDIAVTDVSTTATTHGTVSLLAGSITYTPEADYAGPADFSYAISDGHGGTATASVAVTVAPVNDAPIVIASTGAVSYVENAAPVTLDPDLAVADIDGATLVSAAVQIATGCTASEDVLALAAPPGGITSAYVAATCTLTLSGTASIATFQTALRAVTYANTSDAPATTGRIVTFTVDDGGAVSGTGSATRDLSVTAVDDDPVAVNDNATVLEDAAATAIDVLLNDSNVDGGPISIDTVTQPVHGAVVTTGGGTGLSYAPNANYCNRNSAGAPLLDRFMYTLSPGGSTATVAVTVTCVDDPPIALADTATVAEGTVNHMIDVLANDNANDIDGGANTVAQVTQPAHGDVAIAIDGASVVYTPASGYCNQAPNAPPDTFTYQIAPGLSSATVTVSVTCACGMNKPTDFVVGSN